MSYISTNHRGGIGNVLFKLAASISTAIDNNVDYLFSNEFIRSHDIYPIPGSLGRPATQGFPDYRLYYSNILRNVQFMDRLLESHVVYTEPGFHYNPIPYQVGTNLLLDGQFQSEKYFENNKEKIVDLFKISDEIEAQIKESIPNVESYASLHVRRGDYTQLPGHHPVMTREYYQQAVEKIGIDKTYLVFSDDLKGCVDLLDFIPNKHFYETGVDWMDFYIMSMCGDNIMANSSFSWWAAYLNKNVNKKVVAPSTWFGPVYSHFNTEDLIPNSWIKL
jgi:hypothetical protein